MEKPQVRKITKLEKKLGRSSTGSIYGDRSERKGGLVVWEEFVERPDPGDRDRQRLRRSVPVLRVVCRSLPGVFQCDDGEDGPPVHAPHAGAITHEVVVDSGTIRAHLRENSSSR